MASFIRKLWKDRRGNVLVIAAGALPLVIGSAGLATDTIQWAMWKRQLQRAADSGAIAGVYAKIQYADHESAVHQDLAHNSHVGITTTTDIENSPSTGAYSSDPYAVRVTLSVQKSLSFSSLFLSAAPTITATATATIVPSGEYCVVSLEPTATTGITATGSAVVDLGCGMITNSTSMEAAVATGAAMVNASPIAAVGGITASDNWGDHVELRPFTAEQEDPFADVEPDTTGCPGPNVTVVSNQSRTLDAGCYGNLTFNGTVELTGGTYILDAGSLRVGSQAVVTCTGANGCVFVLTSRTADTNPGSIGNVHINGGAQVNLTAPSSGPYAGLLMYQDRRALDSTSANHQNLINGNASSAFQGAFYFPNQETTFNGTAGMQTSCMQLVARRVILSGNSSISNSCPENSGASAFEGRTVKLVE